MREKPEREGRIPALSHPRPPPPPPPPPPPHHPPIPGMMSAFIDFVKPFSMLLPMCLQDSKSRSIRGGGLWGEIRGETSKSLGRKITAAEPTTTLQLSSSLPRTFPPGEPTGMPLWAGLSSLLCFSSVVTRAK